jgi:hypothetical protein
MATTSSTKRSTRTTIKIGEYKKGEVIHKAYSKISKTTAQKLGVTGKDGGDKLITKIKKGRAAGAQYARYVVGGSANKYTLYFLRAKKTETVSQGGREVKINTYHEKIVLPTPAGTPLAVVAQFCSTLKRKPVKIATPKGVVHHFNNSKTSQGQ